MVAKCRCMWLQGTRVKARLSLLCQHSLRRPGGWGFDPCTFNLVVIPTPRDPLLKRNGFRTNRTLPGFLRHRQLGFTWMPYVMGPEPLGESSCMRACMKAGMREVLLTTLLAFRCWPAAPSRGPPMARATATVVSIGGWEPSG